MFSIICYCVFLIANYSFTNSVKLKKMKNFTHNSFLVDSLMIFKKLKLLIVILIIMISTINNVNAISIVFPATNPTTARICEKPSFEIMFNNLPTNQIHTLQCLFEVRVGSPSNPPISLSPAPSCDGQNIANEIVDLTVNSSAITPPSSGQNALCTILPNTVAGDHQFQLTLTSPPPNNCVLCPGLSSSISHTLFPC